MVPSAGGATSRNARFLIDSAGIVPPLQVMTFEAPTAQVNPASVS
jgi:hypothetical protein